MTASAPARPSSPADHLWMHFTRMSAYAGQPVEVWVLAVIAFFVWRMNGHINSNTVFIR